MQDKTILVHHNPKLHSQTKPSSWLEIEKNAVDPDCDSDLLFDTWSLYEWAYQPMAGVVIQDSWIGMGTEALLLTLRKHSVRTLVMTGSVFDELLPLFHAPTIHCHQVMQIGTPAQSQVDGAARRTIVGGSVRISAGRTSGDGT